jgi:hypothetical protein
MTFVDLAHRPHQRITIREARANRKATRHQTSLGGDGEISFMSLPGELRNEIYRLTLVELDIIRIRLRSKVRPHPFLERPFYSGTKPWREPGLLRANNSIRLEALSVYYGLNDFSVCICPEDIGRPFPACSILEASANPNSLFSGGGSMVEIGDLTLWMRSVSHFSFLPHRSPFPLGPLVQYAPARSRFCGARA